MFFLKSLGLKVWAWVAGLAIGAAVLYKIYKAGETGAKVDSLERTLNSVKRSKEIEANIDNLPDDDVAARLRENGWHR